MNEDKLDDKWTNNTSFESRATNTLYIHDRNSMSTVKHPKQEALVCVRVVSGNSPPYHRGKIVRCPLIALQWCCLVLNEEAVRI